VFLCLSHIHTTSLVVLKAGVTPQSRVDERAEHTTSAMLGMERAVITEKEPSVEIKKFKEQTSFEMPDMGSNGNAD